MPIRQLGILISSGPEGISQAEKLLRLPQQYESEQDVHVA
jgi:hypothetical protein